MARRAAASAASAARASARSSPSLPAPAPAPWPITTPHGAFSPLPPLLPRRAPGPGRSGFPSPSRNMSSSLPPPPSSPSLPSHPSPPSRGLLGTVWQHLGMYSSLSKARLSALVVSTAAAGFVLGSGEAVDWQGLFWVSLGTMGAASSANAFNQASEAAGWAGSAFPCAAAECRRGRPRCAPRLTPAPSLPPRPPIRFARQIAEVQLDATMRRTARRPLPSGAMPLPAAVAFAVAAGAAGLGTLYVKVRLRMPEGGRHSEKAAHLHLIYLSGTRALAKRRMLPESGHRLGSHPTPPQMLSPPSLFRIRPSPWSPPSATPRPPPSAPPTCSFTRASTPPSSK